MEIKGKVAVITGAASGIGQATALELANRGAKAIALVDRSSAVEELAAKLKDLTGRPVTRTFIGDTTDAAFRRRVFDDVEREAGLVQICIPAAGITRDALAVRMDKATGKAVIYPEEHFNLVLQVNLVAPTYWALEMISRIAQDRARRNVGRWQPDEGIQGTAIFIGSVSSQGNKGQVSYAATKAGLEGVARTLQTEAIFHGVRFCVIHPGFTDTPMVRALGKEYIDKYILPFTQLRRLIRPDEIANAICFMVGNSAVSGELWCDAGWHPSA